MRPSILLAAAFVAALATGILPLVSGHPAGFAQAFSITVLGFLALVAANPRTSFETLPLFVTSPLCAAVLAWSDLAAGWVGGLLFAYALPVLCLAVLARRAGEVLRSRAALPIPLPEGGAAIPVAVSRDDRDRPFHALLFPSSQGLLLAEVGRAAGGGGFPRLHAEEALDLRGSARPPEREDAVVTPAAEEASLPFLRGASPRASREALLEGVGAQAARLLGWRGMSWTLPGSERLPNLAVRLHAEDALLRDLADGSKSHPLRRLGVWGRTAMAFPVLVPDIAALAGALAVSEAALAGVDAMATDILAELSRGGGADPEGRRRLFLAAELLHIHPLSLDREVAALVAALSSYLGPDANPEGRPGPSAWGRLAADRRMAWGACGGTLVNPWSVGRGGPSSWSVASRVRDAQGLAEGIGAGRAGLLAAARPGDIAAALDRLRGFRLRNGGRWPDSRSEWAAVAGDLQVSAAPAAA